MWYVCVCQCPSCFSLGVLSLPRSIQCSPPLSMCVEQQVALGRGPLFTALVRPFRAPNLTGCWRKDLDASESLVRGRVLHAPRLLTACTAGRHGGGAPPALGAETRSGACPGPAGERKHTWGGPPHTFASIAPATRPADSTAPAQIHHDEQQFRTSVCAGIIRLREAFPLNGEPRTHARRDMRRGGARGRVCSAGSGLLDRLTHGDGQMVVTLRHEWDDPHAAVATETFSLGGPDLSRLTVDTHVVFKDGAAPRAMRAVYRRL